MAKIILISGKGEHGKTTTANFIKQKLELFFDKRVVIVSFASYLKFVCEKYFGWKEKLINPLLGDWRASEPGRTACIHQATTNRIPHPLRNRLIHMNPIS